MPPGDSLSDRARENMAKEREAVRSEFVKFTTIGQAVAGLVTDFRENDNGPLIEISPVIQRAGRGKEWQRFGSVAVGLGTDLARKISRNDVGSLLLIEFKDKEPTTKGSDLKIFRVLELERDELAKLGLMIEPAQAKEAAAPKPADRQLGDDDDDLPF